MNVINIIQTEFNRRNNYIRGQCRRMQYETTCASDNNGVGCGQRINGGFLTFFYVV